MSTANKVDAQVIKELYKAGKTIKDISIQTNVDSSTVCKYVKRLVEAGELAGRLSRKKDLDIDRVIDLYNKGYSYEDISLELDCSNVTIANKCKQLRNEGILSERKVAQSRARREKAEALKAKKPEKKVYEGYGVKCTKRVAASCIYGNKQSSGLCNYIDIAGKPRTAYKGKSGLNPVEHCSCYKKRGKNDCV